MLIVRTPEQQLELDAKKKAVFKAFLEAHENGMNAIEFIVNCIEYAQHNPNDSVESVAQWIAQSANWE